jgi:hypothetical protein
MAAVLPVCILNKYGFKKKKFDIFRKSFLVLNFKTFALGVAVLTHTSEVRAPAIVNVVVVGLSQMQISEVFFCLAYSPCSKISLPLN